MVLRFSPGVSTSRLKLVIDEKVVERNLEKQKVRSSMYASDYGQCMRKVWFSFFPVEFPVEVFDARTLRIFHNGEDVHSRLGDYLKRDSSLCFVDEVNVPRDVLDVHGRCDGICVVDGRATVVEFKSINQEKVFDAKDEHVGQLTWYLMMFKMLRKNLKEGLGFSEDSVFVDDGSFQNLSDVEKWLLFSQGELQGELIYESKQTQETFHFPMEYKSERAAKVRLWFEQLKWHVDNKVRPVVKYDKNKFPCSWKTGRCPYYGVCWGDKGA